MDVQQDAETCLTRWFFVLAYTRFENNNKPQNATAVVGLMFMRTGSIMYP